MAGTVVLEKVLEVKEEKPSFLLAVAVHELLDAGQPQIILIVDSVCFKPFPHFFDRVDLSEPGVDLSLGLFGLLG